MSKGLASLLQPAGNHNNLAVSAEQETSMDWALDDSIQTLDDNSFCSAENSDNEPGEIGRAFPNLPVMNAAEHVELYRILGYRIYESDMRTLDPDWENGWIGDQAIFNLRQYLLLLNFSHHL